MKGRLLLLLILIPFLLSAQQQDETAAYPQDYFRNPLDIPIFLAGNFGECRPGHFHSGVDIKTLGKENEPVHAAADGYISRIKMEKGGFGHGLYITHSNGYTTLYAHLNKFAPEMQQYMEAEQYAKKHWDVDISLPPAQFPVKKGQLIAWSGNTGASTAPHLHFEIRNTQTEHPLNPELFGLPIVDKTPPVVAGIMVYGGNIYTDEPVYYTVALQNGTYRPVKTDNPSYGVKNDTIQVPAGLDGIGINTDDFMDSSNNTIAFYTTKLYLDDSLQAQVTLDDIGYDETRYINAYADYKTKQLQNKWVQCLFQLPGNQLGHIFHHLNGNKGRLDIRDGKVHHVRILITDDKGNTSNVSFFVKPQPAVISMQSDCTPFYVGKQNRWDDAGISFMLDERQLYDDICFHFKKEKDEAAYSDKYQLHYGYVPVHHYFDLLIKPNKAIAPDLQHKVVMLYTDGKDQDGRAAVMADNGWYKAKVRDFGNYWLDVDTIPPVIKPLEKNNSNLSKAKQIAFEVMDNMTSVKSFSGYVDGKWICFEQHGNLFFYNFDAHCPRGRHKLVFRAADESGNEKTFNLNFVR